MQRYYWSILEALWRGSSTAESCRALPSFYLYYNGTEIDDSIEPRNVDGKAHTAFEGEMCQGVYRMCMLSERYSLRTFVWRRVVLL